MLFAIRVRPSFCYKECYKEDQSDDERVLQGSESTVTLLIFVCALILIVLLVYCFPGRLTCSSYSLHLRQASLKPSANASTSVRTFVLLLRLFVYNGEDGKFDAVPGMPLCLPQQICNALSALQQVDLGT